MEALKSDLPVLAHDNDLTFLTHDLSESRWGRLNHPQIVSSHYEVLYIDQDVNHTT